MCDNCIHKPVCSIYRATGGNIIRCRHHKDERRGRWLNWKGEPFPKGDFGWTWTCSVCKNTLEYEEPVTAEEFPSNFCPNCGADMRSKGEGEEDAYNEDLQPLRMRI